MIFKDYTMTFEFESFEQEPCYVISVAAKIIGVHEQTLRYYERLGICIPSRTTGRHRLYSAKDLDKFKKIKTIIEDMGVNLAGAQLALQLMEQVIELRKEIENLKLLVEHYRKEAENNGGNDGYQTR